TSVVRNPDGSVQTSSVRRPVADVKKDCAAWVARHRKVVGRPIEKAPELWRATPEPFLPGLNVGFTMTPAQVLAVHRNPGLPCKHSPERRWMNGGAAFVEPETVTVERSLLGPVNKGLAGLRFVFEDGRLSTVRLTRLGRGREVVAPLVGPLGLQ